jgi:hypothetical protein
MAAQSVLKISPKSSGSLIAVTADAMQSATNNSRYGRGLVLRRRAWRQCNLDSGWIAAWAWICAMLVAPGFRLSAPVDCDQPTETVTRRQHYR